MVVAMLPPRLRNVIAQNLTDLFLMVPIIDKARHYLRSPLALPPVPLPFVFSIAILIRLNQPIFLVKISHSGRKAAQQ